MIQHQYARRAEAAARELREETGLVVAPEDLGDPIAHPEGAATLGRAAGRFRDDLFLLRVDILHVDVSGFEAQEAAVILGHRRWSLPELRCTGEVVFPLGLRGPARRVASVHLDRASLASRRGLRAEPGPCGLSLPSDRHWHTRPGHDRGRVVGDDGSGRGSAVAFGVDGRAGAGGGCIVMWPNGRCSTRFRCEVPGMWQTVIDIPIRCNTPADVLDRQDPPVPGRPPQRPLGATDQATDHMFPQVRPGPS